jgi:hypothetical protein
VGPYCWSPADFCSEHVHARDYFGDVTSTIKSLTTDLMIVVGFGGISYGTWSIYPPAAFVVGGVLLLVAGVLGARR